MALMKLAYFALGIVQVFAIMVGLEVWLGFHWLLAIIIGLILAFIPFLGTAMGIAGAIVGWQWHWIPAVLLFFGPLVLFILCFGVSGLLIVLNNKR